MNASNGSLSDRGRSPIISAPLCGGEFSEPVLNYLVDIATRNEPVRRLIAYVLKQVNHPIAVQYLVMLAAEMENRAEKEGRISSLEYAIKA